MQDHSAPMTKAKGDGGLKETLTNRVSRNNGYYSRYEVEGENGCSSGDTLSYTCIGPEPLALTGSPQLGKAAHPIFSHDYPQTTTK
ncbi:hypothetical protein AARAC_001256, partial [Aspergillus arachidicola]